MLVMGASMRKQGLRVIVLGRGRSPRDRFFHAECVCNMCWAACACDAFAGALSPGKHYPWHHAPIHAWWSKALLACS